MKEALLLIDIQMDYFAPAGKFPLDGSDAAVTAAHRLVEDFRKKGVPVVHVKHEGVGNVPFMVKGSEGTAIHSLVAPIAGETVISKQTPNAFFLTDLNERLRAFEVGKLTIVGFMANMCVDATARAAREHGYTVEIVPEAVTACAIGDIPATTVKEVFLGALNRFIATLVPMEEKLARY